MDYDVGLWEDVLDALPWRLIAGVVMVVAVVAFLALKFISGLWEV